MSTAYHHAEWLSLLEISGPFLSMPVLLRAFPQGLEAGDADVRRELRVAYEEWLDNQGGLQPDPAIHRAWVRWVLGQVLGFPDEVVEDRTTVGNEADWPSVVVAEHGETLEPDLIVVNPSDPFAPTADEGAPRLLIQILPPGQKLDKALAGQRWKASPATRMMMLLHGSDVRLGLITNGEQWMLVHAPRDQTTGFISWYAELWLEEPLTLRAFSSLLGAHRFFGVPDDETLEALLAESADDQQEVTDQLGRQVRRAVEVLVQAIDEADQDQSRSLLQDVSDEALYEAAVTVMMRLVFLLSAEERGLLLLDDPIYNQYYAISTLRGQLHEVADQSGEELLERRYDAWGRLTATFRAVHGGIHHDRLQLPAYGGSLFDPDRFPFLEGRTSATTTGRGAGVLRIHNRTVLHLLDALQMLEMAVPGGSKQARRLSFRALDVEQIGHVYEGLLDHHAVRAQTTVLGLVGTKNKEPEIPLPELEDWSQKGDKDFIKYLKEQSGRSESALRRGLQQQSGQDFLHRLRAACGNDGALYDRILPYAGLVREDDYEQPVVILAGSLYVTAGSERRATGTHYTPRSLTEPIVQYTLEPQVYLGPAQGKPREEWLLRAPAELLNLKVCDMAMGSGAFLVQACRYLSERLVEAWEEKENVLRVSLSVGSDSETNHEPRITAEGEPAANPDTVLPFDPDERLALARRLVADRCLYGVDKNPLAVEMAKLSLWLITLDKGRPFTFLDHAFKCGDSIIGADEQDLLRWVQTLPGPAMALYLEEMQQAIDTAREKRQELESFSVNDIQDAEIKRFLLVEAEEAMIRVRQGADLLVGSRLLEMSASERESLQARLLVKFVAGEEEDDLDCQQVSAAAQRHNAFHWPFEFPEVFLEEGRSGFDAFVGNPPFIGGKRIRDTLGDEYRAALNTLYPQSNGNADFCAFFFLQGFDKASRTGTMGLIATNTIAQGDTRLGGLEVIAKSNGTIYRAINNRPWPGVAAVVVDVVHIAHGTVKPPFILDEKEVKHISTQLDTSKVVGDPFALKANQDKSFVGSFVNGMGFVLDLAEAEALIAKNPKNREVIFPYLNGQDLNSHSEQAPSRWVINFFDWPLQRGAPGSWLAADAKKQREWLGSGTVPEDYPEPVAADYPDCLDIVRERVYPVRAKVRRKAHRVYWWHYGDKRPLLYATIAPLKRVLVTPIVSKYVSCTFVPGNLVYAHRLVVFPFDSDEALAILQSFIHEAWARQHSSTLETRINYSPSDCFETFPFPDLSLTPTHQTLSNLGETYHEHRRQIMLARQEGLTKTYNRFHDPDETAEDIVHLRELHVVMDEAVVAAYGWEELALEHGWHETQQGLRYTISEPARREVLARLLELNHARYAEEVAAGLHDKKGKGKRKAATTSKKKSAKSKSESAEDDGQMRLF